MEKLWENLANLLKVKTVVTFTVVLVFAVGMVALGAVFGVIRTLFNIDPIDGSSEE